MIPFPPPSALGFPPKFTDWRQDQLTAFQLMLDRPERFIGLTMPTGCLTGDTVVFTNRGGCGQRETLHRIYQTQKHWVKAAYTRSFTGSKIGLHRFEAVTYTGKHPTWQLFLEGGRTLRGTADHQILTDEGFKPLEALTPHDHVVCDTPRPPQGKGATVKLYYRQVQGLRHHPYANGVQSHRKRGNNIEGRLWRVPFHRLVAEADLNGITVSELVSICRYDTITAATLVFLDPEEFAVHHRDRNTLNNDRGNLQILTHAAHLLLHGDESRFGQGVPRYEGVVGVQATGLDEPVYDLVACAPYANFVANEIVVHNSGKGLSYMAGAVLTSGRRVVLTSTLGLMDQNTDDFGSMGLYDIRGQGHYVCNAMLNDGEHNGLQAVNGPGTGLPMCDQGPCHLSVPCTLKTAGCGFYDRVRLSMVKPLIQTNYAFWMAEKRWSQGLGAPPDLLILDEAHQAERELAGALTIQLERWLAKAVGLALPSGYTLSQWRDWALYHVNQFRAKLDIAPAHWSATDLKYRRRLRAVERILRSMTIMTVGHWIEDSTPDAVVFEILHPASFAEDLLFQGAKKVVLTSATLTDKTMDLLGIPKDDRFRWECPSRFPVARRPIIYVPTVRVDFKSMQHQENRIHLYNRINQIAAPRKGRKGIVHSVSYTRAQQIVAWPGHERPARLSVPPKGGVADAVKYFKETIHDPILVSPALTTGWDFPDATCRFQIVAKLPFPDAMTQVTQARAALDEDYVPHLMTQTLIQTVGRIVRNDGDWGETFIIDSHWEWVRKKYKHFFTQWFLEAVRESKTVPLPLSF